MDSTVEGAQQLIAGACFHEPRHHLLFCRFHYRVHVPHPCTATYSYVLQPPATNMSRRLRDECDGGPFKLPPVPSGTAFVAGSYGSCPVLTQVNGVAGATTNTDHTFSLWKLRSPGVCALDGLNIASRPRISGGKPWNSSATTRHLEHPFVRLWHGFMDVSQDAAVRPRLIKNIFLCT